MLEGLQARLLLARSRVYQKLDPISAQNLKLTAIEIAHELGRIHASKGRTVAPALIRQEEKLHDYYQYGVDFEIAYPRLKEEA